MGGIEKNELECERKNTVGISKNGVGIMGLLLKNGKSKIQQ